MAKRIKGMSMSNPVRLDRDYLIKTAKYAIENGFRHFEIIGPTHDPVRGNCDGMIYYRKYSEFNCDKDGSYVDFCTELVNEVCAMLKPHGIKTYYWHHELEIPLRFDEIYPEIHNSDGDVEVTHPLIKDFLENKIEDFFFTYPDMDGIVLTLHETRIPLLKLKNQKIGKIERVKYVTEILYNTCKRLGKELIVRPFASMASDYDDLMAAYSRISSELTVCDKWTQYDWSLTMPSNEFFNKISNNPLIVETDIFGEYFGKGFFPIMLKDHIVRKYAYCENFNPRGYVSRIDRGGFIPFDTPNEVNIDIMSAVQDGRDVNLAIDAFFKRNYGEVWKEVRALMEDTEDLQIDMLYINRVEFCMLSQFPSLSYIITAQKIEMFRDKPELDETAWYIPKGYVRPPLEELISVKRSAVVRSESKLAQLRLLSDRLPKDKYDGLLIRFLNMYHAARLWEQLTLTCAGIAMFFEHKDEKELESARRALAELIAIDNEAYAELGDNYFTHALVKPEKGADNESRSRVPVFVSEISKLIDLEVDEVKRLEKEELVDYVVCGSINERHSLKKEINFSSSHRRDDGVCRLAGSARGKAWSVVKAHGWFSYDVKVKPNAENVITVSARGFDSEHIDFSVTVGNQKTVFRKEGCERCDFVVPFTETEGCDKVTVRFDRITEYAPCIYTLKVK